MTISLSPSDWVRSPHPLPQPALRLLCLPHAGGEASLFRTFPALLSPDLQERVEICPIQLPGRGHRLHEAPLFTSIPALIDVLVPSDLEASPLFPFVEKPFAFFGASSLGGILAFELAQALTNRHGREPLALLIASCRAPHLPGPYALEGSNHLADAELIEQIRAYGGTPEYILTDAPLMERILPKLRADALLQATYSYTPDLALNCPITVCIGREDAFVSLPECAAWQAHTSGAFRLHQFPGDHFFVRDAPQPIRAQLLEYLSRTLRTVMEAPCSQDRQEPSFIERIPQNLV